MTSTNTEVKETPDSAGSTIPLPSTAAQRLLELKRKILKGGNTAVESSIGASTRGDPVQPLASVPLPIPDMRTKPSGSESEQVSAAKKAPLTLRSLMSSKTERKSAGSVSASAASTAVIPSGVSVTSPSVVPATAPSFKPFVSRLKEAPALRSSAPLIRSNIVSFKKTATDSITMPTVQQLSKFSVEDAPQTVKSLDEPVVAVSVDVVTTEDTAMAEEPSHKESPQAEDMSTSKQAAVGTAVGSDSPGQQNNDLPKGVSEATSDIVLPFNVDQFIQEHKSFLKRTREQMGLTAVVVESSFKKPAQHGV